MILLSRRRRDARFNRGRYGGSLSFNVVGEGDSITVGIADVSYIDTAVDALNEDYDIAFAKVATTGDKVDPDAEGRAATVDAMLDGSKRNILSVFFGANDLTVVTAETFFASLKSYCLARIEAGWMVVVGTIIDNDNDAGHEARRTTANAAIDADHTFYHAKADFNAEALLGGATAAQNTTYFSDGIHPTATGQALMATIFEPALESLFTGAAPAVTTITVTPNPASVTAATNQQFTALVLDQYGAKVLPVPTITWQTTNGTIDANGLLTSGAAATGQTVTATIGAVSGTADLTVTAEFSPADIAGLHIWIKADSESYSDGNAVTTATDRSGGARNATAPGNDPTYKTNIINGKAVYRFNGAASEYLQWGDVLTGLTAGEVFIVLAVDTEGGNRGHWRMGSDNNGDLYPFSGGNIFDAWGSTTRHNNIGNSADLTLPQIWNVRSSSSEWTAVLSGTQVHTTGTNTVGWHTAPEIGRDAAGIYFTGDIAEMIIYDSVLSAGDRTSVKNHLATKYNITVA